MLPHPALAVFSHSFWLFLPDFLAVFIGAAVFFRAFASLATVLAAFLTDLGRRFATAFDGVKRARFSASNEGT